MKEIKSCPFCGAEAEAIRTKDISQYWYIQCKGLACGARILARDSKEKATEHWNNDIKRG